MTYRHAWAVFGILSASCVPDDIGIATQKPEITVTPNPIAFGDEAVPLATALPLAVLNAGHADLEFTLRLEGDTEHAFSLAVTEGTVPPSKTLSLDVGFKPTTFLDYTAELVISSNDETDPEIRVPISGTGVSAPLPDIQLDRLSIDFGETAAPTIQVLIVGNVGTAPLHLGTITQEGSPAFKLVADLSGNTIASGNEVPLVISYTPSDTDGDSGTLVIPSDDPDENPVEIVLLGNGGADFEYPVAVINCPGTVAPPTFVQLDGYASHDPAGNTPLVYAWTLAASPTDSGGTSTSSGYLTNAVSDTTRLWADAVGAYEVNLTVTNTLGVRSAPARCLLDAVPSEQVHIELTWNTSNADLDLHVAQSEAPIFARPGDTNWCNRAPSWGVAGTLDDPRLDLDDRAGFGPENTNIEQPADGTYDVRVHYFDDQGDDVVTASVRVYLEGVLAFEGNRNLSRNEVWDAARINWPQGTAAALSTAVYVSPKRQCYTP